MTIKELKAVAEGKSALPLERVNVRVDADAAPLMRVLRLVEFRKHGTQRWLYWYWTPEQPGAGEDLNGIDCGYSGRHLSEAA